jgi:malonyl CoA-acyl carrier protein transacylase
LDPSLLEGFYIPNLVASPFAVNKAYAELIYNRTSSPRLSKVLRKWDEGRWDAPEQRQNLAWVLLVELLSYQFASSVRWIETQDLFFEQYKFDRFIEVGPSPTLTGMATRTLKAKYEAKDDSNGRVRRVFCASKHQKEIYYQFEDEPEATSESDAPAEAANPATTPAAAPLVHAAPPPTGTIGPAASIEDVPIRAVDILAVIVSQKLKKQLSEVPLSKSIKDLSNGKSTLQNEIMGDLQGEFSSAPDKGEELPLEELGAALGSGHSGNLGKYSSSLVSRAIGGKMPGGFNISSAKAHLSKTWGLGPQRADAVLLIATTMEPAKRLGSEAEGKAWLDAAAQAYAQRVGISLSTGGGGGGSAGSSSGAVMNSEEFLKFQAEQHEFAYQQINLYSRYLKRDPRQGEILYDKERASSAQIQARLDSIASEHGDTYIDGIQPVFDALKARHFDSSWNWVRQDAILMFYDILFGRLTTVDREITARCIAIMNRADRNLIKFMEFMVNRCDPAKGETYATAKKLGQELLDNCRGVVGQPPLYKDGEYVFPEYSSNLICLSYFPYRASHRNHREG